MKRLLLVVLLAAVLGAGVGWLVPAAAAPPPPRPEQPHTDQFDIAGYGNLAPLNPVNVKAQNQRTASYRLLLMSGCSAGAIPGAMTRVEAEARDKLAGFALVRNDFAYDFTVRINCGSDHIRICGAINIFCLGRGFPYVADVDISDILSTYQSITQLSILLHEIVGHALATWNEQYCLGIETTGICRGLARFASAPGWRDVMNTGELSRHGLEAIELERWSRTMYDVLAAPIECAFLGYDECSGRWRFLDKWSWSPATGEWYGPTDLLEYSACNGDGVRWAFRIARWTVPTSNYYDPALGYWSRAPEC